MRRVPAREAGAGAASFASDDEYRAAGARVDSSEAALLADADAVVQIRPPSLHALSALPYIVPGATVSDAVAILGSMDPIMGEVDR